MEQQCAMDAQTVVHDYISTTEREKEIRKPNPPRSPWLACNLMSDTLPPCQRSHILNARYVKRQFQQPHPPRSVQYVQEVFMFVTISDRLLAPILDPWSAKTQAS